MTASSRLSWVLRLLSTDFEFLNFQHHRHLSLYLYLLSFPPSPLSLSFLISSISNSVSSVSTCLHLRPLILSPLSQCLSSWFCFQDTPQDIPGCSAPKVHDSFQSASFHKDSYVPIILSPNFTVCCWAYLVWELIKTNKQNHWESSQLTFRSKTVFSNGSTDKRGKDALVARRRHRQWVKDRACWE